MPHLVPESAVDVWFLPASLGGALRSLSSVLTDADRKAAKRYRHIGARRRWLTSRAMLRIALHVTTRGLVPAQEWQFQTGASGRPSVAAGLPRVSFSLSQNEVVSVIAVSTSAVVGVDVECLDQSIDEHVIGCFASPRERVVLGAKTRSERSRTFLKLWTLKEAYAKMLGLGLSADFALLEFSLNPVRFVGKEPVGLKTWTMTFEDRPCQVSLAFCSGTSQTARAQLKERTVSSCQRLG